MTTENLRVALRKRYPMPEYCLMEEVRDSTGHASQRSADAVSMGLWPSRGMLITGFEIKASRADWRRELKNPVKAESIAAYCDQWYVVTLPDVVKDGELPPTWGLMELGARYALTVRGEAPKNTDVKPLTRAFVASMMRRAGEYDAIQLELKLAGRADEYRRRANADAEQVVTRGREQADRITRDILDVIEAIKARTGIDLNEWTPTDEVVRRIAFATRTTDLTSAFAGLATLHQSIQQVSQDLVSAMEALRMPFEELVPTAKRRPLRIAALPTTSSMAADALNELN